jgi:hypothetical protein
MRILLSRIKGDIPPEILGVIFNPRQLPSVSVEREIIDRVIHGRVLLEVNLVAGKNKEIILRRQYLEPVQWTSDQALLSMGKYAFYRIPPEARENRIINKVVSIEYPGYYNAQMTGAYPYNQYHGARLGNIARAVLQSQTQSQYLATPTASIEAGDLIRLTPPQMHHIDWILNCKLAFNEDFQGLTPNAILSLSDLVLSAVKNYIYVNSSIPMDQAAVLYGTEIGVIKDIIGSYSSEGDIYRELLIKFHGGAALNMKQIGNLFRACL